VFVFKDLRLKILFECEGFRDLCSDGVFSGIRFETQQQITIVQAYDARNAIAEKLKQMESISLTVD
jgi:hypothetical protein